MESSESTVDFMLWVLIIVILLHIVGNGKYFVIWIRHLVYLLHLPLLRVVFPGNVTNFFEMTLLIATFDVMENFFSFDAAVGIFDDDIKTEIIEQIKNMNDGQMNESLK